MSENLPESPAVPTNPFVVTVECYAGHRGEETPRALVIGSRRVAVVEVLDRWLAPEHRYFKVRGDDGDVYILRHCPAHGWELTMFARGDRPQSGSR
jgi:hypothetical protein